MGWASTYIAKLRAGETVSFRPRGQSMSGRIESGQLCIVAPVNAATLEVGDIVLCKVGGSEYLHLVKGNWKWPFSNWQQSRSVNGWVAPNSIFGKCIRIES